MKAQDHSDPMIRVTYGTIEFGETIDGFIDGSGYPLEHLNEMPSCTNGHNDSPIVPILPSVFGG